jgi:hypothetical protein
MLFRFFMIKNVAIWSSCSFGVEAKMVELRRLVLLRTLPKTSICYGESILDLQVESAKPSVA